MSSSFFFFLSIFLSFFLLTRRGREVFPSWARLPKFLCRTRRWFGRSWTCRWRQRSWLPSWPTNLGSVKKWFKVFCCDYENVRNAIREKNVLWVFLEKNSFKNNLGKNFTLWSSLMRSFTHLINFINCQSSDLLRQTTIPW